MASKTAPKDGAVTELRPEQLATMAKKFVESPYGEWFIEWVKTQRDAYVKVAETFSAPPETKLAALERAAGIGEVLDLFGSQLLYGEHPEYFETKPETEEELKAQEVLTNW